MPKPKTPNPPVKLRALSLPEIQQALQAGRKTSSGGFTRRDVEKEFGFSRSKVNWLLQDLVEAGELSVHREQRHRIDGQTFLCPVYRWTSPPEGKKD